MLEVRDLAFHYPEKDILNAVNFAVAPGTVLYLQGHNGAGKTTLLKILSGLLEPSAGTVLFHGQAIQDHLAPYQQQLCFIGHKLGISPLLSIQENYQYNMHTLNADPSFEDTLRFFSLYEFADKPCGLLSAGQQKRASLLQLRLRKARLWLLDEPFNALDKEGVTLLGTIIQQQVEQGGIIILTSHQPLALSTAFTREYYL